MPTIAVYFLYEIWGCMFPWFVNSDGDAGCGFMDGKKYKDALIIEKEFAERYDKTLVTFQGALVWRI